ncbi:MAG: hypothetical protein AAGG75_16030 [Bacteroidota bacterium]
MIVKNKINGTIWMLLIMVLLIGWRHHQWLASPTQQYMGDTYDGFRTLMAVTYHAKHDSTYVYYHGMNYPYGDRFSFCDSQPIFSNTVKFISEHIVDISDYAPLVLHVAMLLSLLFCGLLLYWLFRKLKLPDWYSIPIAVGITFLSPQLDRFEGHYGLAYTFVIPLCLYLLYLFEEKRHWQYSLYMSISLLACSQIHMYLFALALFTVSLYFVFRIVFDWKRPSFLWYGGHWLFQCLLPFVLLEIWMYFYDFVDDRPKYPYGFKAYIAHWQTVFFNSKTMLGKWIHQEFPTRPTLTSEGLVWIGSAALLLLVKEVFRLPINWLRGQGLKAYQDPNFRFLLYCLAAALLLLVASFGIPFFWKPFEGAEMHIGPLRQFRSLGRFAWSFYYIINIVVFYLLWQQCRQYQGWRRLLPILPLFALMGYEAVNFSNSEIPRNYSIPEKRETFRAADYPWLQQIDFDRYQAILPIPYFHIGSENTWLSAGGKVVHRNLWTTVQTGLPSMGVFMTRTSLSQTLNQLEMLAEPYRTPKMLADLPNEKPILVQRSNKEYKDKWYKYDHLFYGEEPIYKDELFTFYELSIDRFREWPLQRQRNSWEELQAGEWHQQQELLSADSLPNFVYQSFDELSAERSYRGGAFTAIGNQANLLFEGPIPQQDKESRYVCSIWAFAQEDLHLKQWLHIRELDAEGKQIKKKDFEMSKYIRSVDDGWVLIDIPFWLESSDSRLRVTIDNYSLYGRKFYVDELQIRRQDARLFKRVGEEFVRNNRWFATIKD